jgi:hypothetical protein
MESEQSQNFNERLNQWVESQGFWFQMRYSIFSSGRKSMALIHLLRLGFRVLIFLLVVTVGILVYLVKRTDSSRFVKGLQEELQGGLSATDLEIRGVKCVQGNMEINRFAAEGGSETFFTTIAARNIRCKMGLLDGVWGLWDPGIIFISRLDINLLAGADDAESARKLGDAWFRESTTVNAHAFEIGDATVHWGYSERTEGAIESSVLKMQRTETGWRMSFKGGWFHQNWLDKLEIVNLVVLCDRDGLVFEKAEMKQGQGTVDFSGLRLIGGERPRLQGVAKIRSLGLDVILPPAPRSVVEGSLSGDFRVFGSTDSSDGIGFEGQVVLDGKDMIVLRQQIHLLEALSVVDYSRNYHRVDFREGSFRMKTSNGGMELSDIKLKAVDLFTLEGELKVRLPTHEEIQQSVVKGTDTESAPVFAGANQADLTRKTTKGESDLTLKRAAQEARQIKDGVQDTESLSLFDRLNMSNVEMRRLQTYASERMSRMLHYEGKLDITIPHDAFERAPLLQERYPVDASTSRIPIKVPIDSNFYELTFKQAEEIYLQGQRKP